MLKNGSVLEDRYRIETRIGDGGSGTVYRAVHIRTGRQLAIKEISRSFFDERSEKAVRILKSIRHQGLPMILDVLYREDSVLIVMEYIPGKTLKAEMEFRFSAGQQFLTDEVLQLGIEICRILDYLHTLPEPLLFRDIKPANLMLRPEGGVTMVDLGTISLQRPVSEEDAMALGTLGYAAPEMFRPGTEQGPEADLYSLGAVLHHMITGINPGENPFSFRKIRTCRPLTPADTRLENALKIHGLERILDRCTRFRKEERYHSAKEMQSALEHPAACVLFNDTADKFRFLLVTAFLLLAAASGVVSSGSERKMEHFQKEGVEYCREKALRAEEEQAFAWVDEALKFCPGDAESIGILLDKVLADGIFSQEEQSRVRLVLDRVEEGASLDNERLLKRDPEAFFRIAYRMGTACFYAAEGIPDHSSAAAWFDEVLAVGKALNADGEGDSEKKGNPEEEISESNGDADGRQFLLKRAEILKKICSYRDSVLSGQVREDTDGSIRLYWTDLTTVLNEDLPAGNLLVVELGLWREILGLMQDWPAELEAQGITWAEQKVTAEKIGALRKALQESKEAEEMPAVRQMLDSLGQTLLSVEKKRQILVEAEERKKWR